MIDMLYQESTVYNQSIKLYTIYLIYSIIIYVHQFPQEIIFHFYGVLGFNLCHLIANWILLEIWISD